MSGKVFSSIKSRFFLLFLLLSGADVDVFRFKVIQFSTTFYLLRTRVDF